MNTLEDLIYCAVAGACIGWVSAFINNRLGRRKELKIQAQAMQDAADFFRKYYTGRSLK